MPKFGIYCPSRQRKSLFSDVRGEKNILFLRQYCLKHPRSAGWNEKQKALILIFLPFVKPDKYKNHINFPESWQLFRGKVKCKDL